MRYSYFNVPIDDVSMDQAVALIQQYLQDGRQHYIVTPNPEMIRRAKYDSEFRAALSHSDLALLDGFGLAVALWILTGDRQPRVTGVALLYRLLETVGQSQKFFFLGGEAGSGEKAASVARQNYKAQIMGAYEPERNTYDLSGKIQAVHVSEHERILEAINKSEAEILILGLGHGYQEKWMGAYLSQCPKVKVAMGVGGALDYLSGKQVRAPKIFQNLGLEWLWRLVREPRRAGRIFIAVGWFPLEVIRWYLRERFIYRQSVVAVVMNSQDEVLLVSRANDPNHWQFPQGGVDAGEALEEALKRELTEEIGTGQFEILGKTRHNVYRYQWPRYSRRKKSPRATPLSVHYGYRGQKQTAFFVRFYGNDSQIKLETQELSNWKWVSRDELLQAVHPLRREFTGLILKQLSNYVSH